MRKLPASETSAGDARDMRKLGASEAGAGDACEAQTGNLE